MAEVLLFHHALGLTPGCRSFADDLRAAGHVVHLPDLYDGKTFGTVQEGVAHAQKVGFGTIMERGVQAAERLPAEIVYGGFSLGVMPAQRLTQTRPGAKGALLISACLPPSEFGAWPQGVPAQVHLMEQDEFALEGDLDAARQLAAEAEGVELLLYPGDKHLFTDSGTADYDEKAAKLVLQRVRQFLEGVR